MKVGIQGRFTRIGLLKELEVPHSSSVLGLCAANFEFPIDFLHAMPQSKRPAAVSKKPAGVSKQKAGKPKCLSCRELRERARVAEAEMVNLMDDKVALRDRCNWLLTVIHTSGVFIDGGKLRRGPAHVDDLSHFPENWPEHPLSIVDAEDFHRSGDEPDSEAE